MDANEYLDSVEARLAKLADAPWKAVNVLGSGWEVQWVGTPGRGGEPDDGQRKPICHMRWTDGMRPEVETLIENECALIASAPADLARLVKFARAAVKVLAKASQQHPELLGVGTGARKALKMLEE